MTHPEPSDNPHAEAFPGLSVDDSGNVLTGHDADGNPVTLHVAAAYGVQTGAGIDLESEGGEQLSPISQTGPDGTEPSTSSPTASRSEQSGGTPSPRPVPAAENPSESDQTTRSTASSTTGGGTAPLTGPTPQSGPADKQS